MTTVSTDRRAETAQAPPPHGGHARRRSLFGRYNLIGGAFGWVWLLIVMIPLYWIVITSLKAQSDYFLSNPMKWPAHPTLENYKLVLDNSFVHFFLNSAIVTICTIIPSTVISFMAAYAIVRAAGNRILRLANSFFLMGLAIPLQAVIIPVFLIIIKLKLYNTLAGIVLPSIAFAIPLSVLVLANFIRDVPGELFESMRMDGANEWRTLWSLAFPLTRPALVTVMIYNGLNTWNNFLLPLVVTQDTAKQTMPLALQTFQTQFGVNIPAVTASVTLSTIPILFTYVIGRRQLLAGLTAGFGK